MAYVTISNSRKIIRKLDEKKLNKISEKLYKWDIYFFSSRESAILKGIRELFRDPTNFVAEYYHPIETVDSYRYIFPEIQPAYHKDDTCEKLKSNFVNIEIPFPVQQKGKDEVTKFREWYKTTTFKDDDPKDYIYKLQARFPYVGEINPKSIEYSNSGSKEKKNYSLPELESEIDTLLRAASAYYNNNPQKQAIIKKYQKWTFLAYVYGEINNNDSGLNDADLKEFLKFYDEQFKKPVKIFLEEYYRVKFNPDMSFEGTILVQLGFRACQHCLKNNDYVLFSIDSNEDNALTHEDPNS